MGNPTATGSGIRAANEQFMEKFQDRDAAGMAALYTTDAQLLPPGAEVVSGRDGVAGFWRAVMDMGIAQANLETAELEERGDTAIEIGRYTLSTTEGGVADWGKYLVVWRTEDGSWKLYRDIWNTSQPAAS